MTAHRSDDLIFDQDALALALRAPPPPRLSPTTMRPPGQKYSLEERLPGVLGSIAPPTNYALRGMTAAYPQRSSNRGLVIAGVLFVLAALTGAAVYRDMHREAPASAAPTTSDPG